MQAQNHPSHSYKYRFWKDHYWIWILLIPIGLISWALPVILFVGLNSSHMPLNAIVLVVVVLGIPSYIAGCAFFYGLMQGISTRVTISEDTISLKKPWFPFPFFTRTRRIRLADISQLKMSLGFGGGTITLFVHKNASKKIRQIPLPQFKDTDYLREMVAIKTRGDPAGHPRWYEPDGGTTVSIAQDLHHCCRDIPRLVYSRRLSADGDGGRDNSQSSPLLL